MVSQDEQVRLQQRLSACVGSPKHPLFGQAVVAMYKTKNTDDVLFSIPSNSTFARVHLTTQLEQNPEYPNTVILKSLMEWLRFELEDVAYLLEQAKIDWEMDVFLPLLKESEEHDF